MVSSLLAAASWQYGTANHGTVSMWLRGWECVAHIRTTYLPTSAISTVGKVLGSFGGQGVSGSLYSSHDRSHGRIGRPQLGIGRDQLEHFVSLSFNWTRIAAILGVSRMTVYCRRQEFGMLDEPRINVSDRELLVLVEDIRKNKPECGEVIVIGELRSHG